MQKTAPQFGIAQVDAKDRPGAYAVIIKDHKILAVLRKGFYHLPGGGIDEGETPEKAALRELKEETGYSGRVVKKLGAANQYVDSQTYGCINKLGSYFIIEVTEKGKKSPEDPTDQPLWISFEEYFKQAAHESHQWIVKELLKSF